MQIQLSIMNSLMTADDDYENDKFNNDMMSSWSTENVVRLVFNDFNPRYCTSHLEFKQFWRDKYDKSMMLMREYFYNSVRELDRTSNFY